MIATARNYTPIGPCIVVEERRPIGKEGILSDESRALNRMLAHACRTQAATEQERGCVLLAPSLRVGQAAVHGKHDCG